MVFQFSSVSTAALHDGLAASSLAPSSSVCCSTKHNKISQSVRFSTIRQNQPTRKLTRCYRQSFE